jgi:hypothetical protein
VFRAFDEVLRHHQSQTIKSAKPGTAVAAATHKKFCSLAAAVRMFGKESSNFIQKAPPQRTLTGPNGNTAGKTGVFLVLRFLNL